MAGQWLRLRASTAGGTGSIPGQGTKILHAAAVRQNFFLFLFFLVLAVLGLRCCLWAFSSCGEWGLLFIAVRWLLIAVASLVAEHGL